MVFCFCQVCVIDGVYASYRVFLSQKWQFLKGKGPWLQTVIAPNECDKCLNRIDIFLLHHICRIGRCEWHETWNNSGIPSLNGSPHDIFARPQIHCARRGGLSAGHRCRSARGNPDFPVPVQQNHLRQGGERFVLQMALGSGVDHPVCFLRPALAGMECPPGRSV